MCARFRCTAVMEYLIAKYGVSERPNFPDNPNVAPTETVPIIRSSTSQEQKLQLARFGLIPAWAKDIKIAASLINAKSETIETKPSFRKPFRYRRCVIPVDGFYEWKEENGKKIPYMVHRKDYAIMSLAGIWDYAEIAGEKIFSFSIITGPPSKLTEPLHDRTPIILDDPDGWITYGGKGYFRPPNDDEIEITRKNPAMNNPRIKNLDFIDL